MPNFKTTSKKKIISAFAYSLYVGRCILRVDLSVVYNKIKKK